MSDSKKIKPKEILDQLENWLKESDQFISYFTHPQIVKGIEFFLNAQIKASLGIPKEFPNKIEITSTIVLAESHKTVIKEFSRQEFEKFWFELFTQLTNFDTDFTSRREGKEIHEIAIIQTIRVEELFITDQTMFKQLFYDKIDNIRRAVFYAIHYINYATGNYSSLLGLSDEN